jgi:septum formation protein
MILYLASGSPRRAELLQQIAVPFTVLPAPAIDETPRPGEVPLDYVQRMASEKAAVGLTRMPLPGAVLGADTAVVLGERILGKPADDADALAMLAQLSGQSHQVISAVCLCLEGRQAVRHSVTTVHFRPLDSARLQAYVATGEGRDKRWRCLNGPTFLTGKSTDLWHRPTLHAGADCFLPCGGQPRSFYC